MALVNFRDGEIVDDYTEEPENKITEEDRKKYGGNTKGSGSSGAPAAAAKEMDR